MSIPDKRHTYAYLFAESTTMPLDSIQSILGLAPDATTQAGDPILRGPAGHVSGFTSWTLYAPIPDDEHLGLYGLTRWLEGLGDVVAERFRQVSELGVHVGLTVVQNMDAEEDLETRSNARNFDLSPAALRWLADAGAGLRIDQYLG